MHEVADEFIRYYEDLLGTTTPVHQVDPTVFQIGATVPPDSLDMLTAPVTEQEIRAVMFSIGTDRAPGPDGYSAGFFRHSWETVGGDVSAAVKEFFESGRLLRQLNHTVLTLLPKSANASSVSEYRPIACRNVIYKVISKILAARMSKTLPGIIDSSQSALVEGRSMRETIYLAQELISKYARKRVSPRCLIKVDLRSFVQH